MQGFPLSRWMIFFSSLLVAVPLVAAQHQAAGRHSKLAARGKYLVEKLGMCGDCHSPRNEKGEFIPNQWLQGTILDFKPMHPVPGWVPASPPIAGLPGWATEQAVRFFMTGIDRSGKSAAPPMPQYRMSRRDAEAVTAYLKSLPADRQ